MSICRRVAAALPRTVAAGALATQARLCHGVKPTDPTYEDDRWLEAMIDEDPEKTAEERYAAEKQREILKKMMSKMRQETHAKIEHHTKPHKAEVAELKTQVAELQAKIKTLE